MLSHKQLVKKMLANPAVKAQFEAQKEEFVLFEYNTLVTELSELISLFALLAAKTKGMCRNIAKMITRKKRELFLIPAC